MKINEDKLQAIAKPLDHDAKKRYAIHRKDRHMHTASAAIAAKILRQMEKIGKSKSQLAKDLDITPANVTRYLSGKTNFELRTLVELERILNIRIIDREVIPPNDKRKIILITIPSQDSYITSQNISPYFTLG